jgi:hypothetical protein
MKQYPGSNVTNTRRTPAKPPRKRPPTVAERVAKHRAGLRAKGMRLVQIWVPDPDNPNFVKEARRQSRLLARAAAEPRSDEAQVMHELDAGFDEMMRELDAAEARAARKAGEPR